MVLNFAQECLKIILSMVQVKRSMVQVKPK
jgi:hypothetical protein